MKATTFNSSAFNRFKAGMALVASAALVMTGFGYLPSAGAAPTDNQDIVINIDQLVRSDANGNEQSGGARVNDVVKMKFTWDATNANPQPGQSFSIGLPAEFNNREPGTTKELVFEGVTAANCTVEAKKLACTFTDAIRDKLNIKGAGSALLQATQTTTKNTVDFKVNDQQTVAVTLPGGVPIGAATTEVYNESPFGKAISPLAHNSKALVWSISFGAPFLKKLPNYTPDGKTMRTIVIRDTLAPGQKFGTDMTKYYLRLGNSAGVIRPNPKPNLTNAAGVDATLEFGNYDFSVDLLSDREAIFTLTGPWMPDTNYSIGYTALPISDTGFVKQGVEYTNTAEVAETGDSQSFTRTYTESFTIDIQMEDGYGSFKATKLITGEGFPLVPVGTKFKVKATWELPGGKNPTDYHGWVAPANPAILEVEVGKAAQYNGTFPQGTVLTLTEEMPDIPGVIW